MRRAPEGKGGPVRVVVKGSGADRLLRARVGQLVVAALGRVPARPASAQVTFTDDNGPKGGAAMRCAVTVRLPKRADVRVEHVAETPRLAFDGAFAALERQLREAVARVRAIRRRPKKYYVAKRLAGIAGPREPGKEG